MTRAETRARTRQRLLDAAAETFARKGYAAASVDEIAESAGFSVGAVYSNFSGKEQLFSELMAERGAQRVNAVSQALQAARDQPGATIGVIGNLLVEAADKDIEFAALQTEFFLHAVRHPETMEILARTSDATIGLLREVIEDALQFHGVDESVTAEAYTIVVLALYQGLIRQRQVDPSRVPEELFGQALSWQIDGMPKGPRANNPYREQN